MKPPFRLVPDDISKDVTEALTQMLKDAEDGQIYGFAFVAMYKGRRIIRNTAGECERNPAYTRGLVAVLDDYLADKMRSL